MSTKTNFKRIALVAVASLGLGLLSSVPSQAALTIAPTLTVTNGTATTSASDSRTAGTVKVYALSSANTDSVIITSVLKSKPTGATTPAALYLLLQDTLTATMATNIRETHNAAAALNTTTDTKTSVAVMSTGSGYIAATFKVFIDTFTTTRTVGNYVYTITATPYGGDGVVVTKDVTITVSALAAESKVASAATSAAYVRDDTTKTAADEIVSSVNTASNDAVGYLFVFLKNAASGVAARESVTITTNIGQVGTSSNRGRSVVLKYDNDAGENYEFYPDGTSGVATISISTPSVTFAQKTISLYAESAKTLTATVATPNLAVGTNTDTVRVTALDANGVVWSGAAYIYASSAADALIAGSQTPVACTWDAADNRHECPVAGNSAGTAKMKVIDASTVALATATSNEVSVVVNANAVASVKLEFDKATYAPSERVRLYVTPLDSAGKPIAAGTWANLLGTGGISYTAGFTNMDTTTAAALTGVSVTTSANSSAATGAKAGSRLFTLYAPASGGSFTVNALGGSSLPLAAQVAVSATATVTDSGAAALAAVTALATTVASLKTLITTLTNLVLKIQKKVKA
ncbi:MAG: hypothetical protein EBW12_07275 [Actinobacteria bacterium]|nr:hypothetical protein [Actinomycetota bacterium]